MPRALVALAVLALLGLAPVASNAVTSATAGGKLVVVGRSLGRDDFGHDGLYVFNADGSGLRQITHSILDEQPHWSPDGSWIAVVRTGALSDKVELIRDDGSGRRVLGSGNEDDAALAAPSPWSPDGTRLAWGGCGGLCVYLLASDTRLAVKLGDVDGSGFAWSPDGTRIAAVDSDGRLVVVAADGSSPPRVISGADGSTPSWSPDGKTIAFRGDSTLELVSPDGGPVRAVAPGETPRWSQDGRLLFYSDKQGVHSFDLLSGRSALVVVGGSLQGMAPDGSAIAYTRGRWGVINGESDVWAAGADGSDARQLTTAFPLGLQYDGADWATGSLPATGGLPPTMLTLPVTAERDTDWVDALAPAGPHAGVAYEAADLICDPDAETMDAVFTVWTPPDRTVTTTTPCGNTDGFGPFAIASGLVGWTAEVIVSVWDYRSFAAVASEGTNGRERARWMGATYDKHIGYVGDVGDLVGDGSLIAFESWSTKFPGRKRLTVHRWLWRVVNDPAPHVRGLRLPADAGDAVAVDGGRIVLLGTHGVLVFDNRLRLLRRVQTPAASSARLGGDELGVVSGNALLVYSARTGRLDSRVALAYASGAPQILSIRNGYAVYTSGLELHLLRLQDGLDRVLDLPEQSGPLGAVLTSRGLFVSYDEAYTAQPGRILFTAWANIS